MDFARKRLRWVLVAFLCFLNIIVWVAVHGFTPKDFVSVYFLDVGQGDAILIEGRNGNRVLVDGGADKTVLRRLNETLPRFARSLDALVGTHPDKDHIGGFPYVLKDYSVGVFIEPGVESENSFDDEIHRMLEEKKVPSAFARRGMIVDFHDGSFLRVLFPDQDVSGWETNEASIVAQYVYGETCFLLTGDSSEDTEFYLVHRYGEEQIRCQVLKAGHHGSRTSTSEFFLSAVRPEYAVISAGKGNSYGHPHAEVIERLVSVGASVFQTSESGTIKIKSDGKNILVK